VDVQAYGNVSVHDPALDVPVPHDDRLHGTSVKGALIGKVRLHSCICRTRAAELKPRRPATLLKNERGANMKGKVVSIS